MQRFYDFRHRITNARTRIDADTQPRNYQVFRRNHDDVLAHRAARVIHIPGQLRDAPGGVPDGHAALVDQVGPETRAIAGVQRLRMAVGSPALGQDALAVDHAVVEIQLAQAGEVAGGRVDVAGADGRAGEGGLDDCAAHA